MNTISSSLNNNLWTSSQESIKKTAPDFISSAVANTQWFIHERGGLAKVAGIALVPSQYLGPGLESGNRRLQLVDKTLPYGFCEKMEKIEITGDRGMKIYGIILYPKGWVPSHSKCIVYNNPNAVTVPEFFDYNDSTPFLVMQQTKCPIIMYDYRGTGISRENERPSAHTVTTDGHTVLNYALSRFENADVWGSSLGGAVATVACDAYLAKHPQHVGRISLYNHDSFTTTGKVVLHRYLNFLATLVGVNIDAESAMRRLAKRGLNTTILCHRNDPVIGKGSRIAEIVPNLRGNIRLIDSLEYGHANLSNDMLHALRGSNN